MVPVTKPVFSVGWISKEYWTRRLGALGTAGKLSPQFSSWKCRYAVLNVAPVLSVKLAETVTWA
jgi:hypothetical protein